MKKIRYIYIVVLVLSGILASSKYDLSNSQDKGVTGWDFSLGRIGDYGSSIYHAESINGLIWLGLTDNTVRVMNSSGSEVGLYSVGAYPGDFAVWNNQN